jgi:transposase
VPKGGTTGKKHSWELRILANQELELAEQLERSSEHGQNIDPQETLFRNREAVVDPTLVRIQLSFWAQFLGQYAQRFLQLAAPHPLLEPSMHGGLAVGKTKRGKGTKIMAIAAGNSVPLAVTIDSASPHESKLVDETLAGRFRDELPEKLMGDKAYDSDPLDRHLDEEYGIEMIAPNRENRSKTQDGRALRRRLRRWVVEPLFAWLHWFRRLVVR